VVTRYPARTREGDLQNMTDQNAQPGPESKPDATPPAGIQWQTTRCCLSPRSRVTCCRPSS